MRSSTLLIAIVGLIGLSAPLALRAGEKKWDGSTINADPATGTASGWFSGSNGNRWRPDGYPTATDYIVLDDSIIALPSTMSVSATQTVQSVTINSTSFSTLNTNGSGTAAQQLGLNGTGGINPILFDLQSASGGALSVGGFGVLTVVANTDGQFSVATGNTLTFSANALISASARTIEKSGGGTLSLQRSNNTASTTIISGGTLLLGSTGSITGSISVKAGADFNVSALASGFTLAAGRTLSGNGTVSGKTIAQGTVAPGASIGSLSVGNQDWATGGQYTWEVNSLPGAGTAGTNWDLLNVGGTLNVTADPSSFKIKLVSLDGGGANPGSTIAGFAPNQQYTWTIASATTLSNFNASKFNFDVTEFSANQSGVWSIDSSGNNVLLVYSTPEPAALLLAPAVLLLRRRGRMRRYS